MTEQLLTLETPTKVMGLLSLSLVSLGFLFAVTISNASFQGFEQSAIVNPFAPSNVVAVLDNVSNKYAFFVNEQAQPAIQSFAIAQENLAWVGDNAAQPIVHVLGLEPLVAYNNYQAPALGQSRVAGAFTSRAFASQ